MNNENKQTDSLLEEKIRDLLCPILNYNNVKLKCDNDFLNADFSLNWNVVKQQFSSEDLRECEVLF